MTRIPSEYSITAFEKLPQAKKPRDEALRGGSTANDADNLLESGRFIRSFESTNLPHAGHSETENTALAFGAFKKEFAPHEIHEFLCDRDAQPVSFERPHVFAIRPPE
jgi:hypothetical protein